MSISPSTKKKILVTGGAGMLAYDYIRMCADRYDIVALDRDTCDISSYESIIQNIAIHSPDILLNLAAYTAVDTAETTGALSAYTVNTLGTYHLARATGAFDIPFISISTDYVFDGTCSTGYTPTDTCSPIGVYGMSKYLGEQMAFAENKKSVVVRTSWLYG
jgi:dTDP-4-dehydrorhamnose reductase